MFGIGKKKTKVKAKPKTIAQKRKTIKAQKAKIERMQKARVKGGLKRVPLKKRTTKRKVSVKTKGRTTIIKIDDYQTPKSRKSLKSDKKRKALPPGRRISKNGNKYTEHRQNRSDKKGKKY